ncbi:small secreted protein [Fusarium mundagurra]|uniref:Small secreted protein n=1 Tax=Fusarium mundagurra TaxID=1567541 RepID=A0A8H5YYL5_9HYPO|nr:small secreted protein [Fusarium mundagurra]
MKFAQVLIALMANTVIATNPKANEYTDSACSKFNYGHHSQDLTDVTMDDTTNSVYLNGGNGFWTGTQYEWSGYSEKSNGQCSGQKLGSLPSRGDCVDLNFHFRQRIKCVRLYTGGPYPAALPEQQAGISKVA